MSTISPSPERQSAEDWVRDHGDWMVAYAYVLTGDRDDALDLAQDCVEKVFRSWDRVRGAESQRAYVRRLITNQFRSNLRRRKPPTRTLDEAVQQAADGADPAGGAHLELVEAMRALPARQQVALVLRYWADLDDADIAAALGCRPGTVRSLISRANAALRVAMGPHDE